MGQSLQSFQVVNPQTTIQLEGLPPGVYFINLYNGAERYAEKFIIAEKL